jgi:hypothetical protein
MSEKLIESYLKSQVKKAGGLSYKFSSPAHRGVPDQILIFPHGSVYFVEVKSAGGSLSRLQVRCISELMEKGCNVHVVYSRKDVDELLRHC